MKTEKVQQQQSTLSVQASKDYQGQQFWFDPDKNTYVLIDESTGKETYCNYGGALPNKFLADKTGFMRFKQRQEIAKIHKPMQCDVPPNNRSYKSQRVLYTPQNDKFEGYSQYPRPQVLPYNNQIVDEIMSNNKHDLVDKQSGTIESFKHDTLTDLNQQYAKKIQSSDKLKQNNIGVEYLTGRMNSTDAQFYSSLTALPNARLKTSLASGGDKGMISIQTQQQQQSRPQTANRKSLKVFGSIANQQSVKSIQSSNRKDKVLNDFNSYSNKFNEEREKRVNAGQIPNPVSPTELRVHKITEVLVHNESGKTIHGRDLMTPNKALLTKFKDQRETHSLRRPPQTTTSQYQNSLMANSIYNQTTSDRFQMLKTPKTQNSNQQLINYQSQGNISQGQRMNTASNLGSSASRGGPLHTQSGFGIKGFNTPASAYVDKETLFSASKQSRCLQDYSIKSKYMTQIQPFLQNKFDILTNFESTKYNLPISTNKKEETQGSQTQITSPPPEPTKSALSANQKGAAAGKNQPPAKGQPPPKAAPTSQAIDMKDKISKEVTKYSIKASEIIERDYQDLMVDVHAPWLATRSKTQFQITYDKSVKERDEKGYIAPPEKPERATTKGRFQAEVKNASEQFVVDKSWQLKANPIAWEAQVKFENWDRNMLEKKRKQKLLKEQLISEGMKHNDSMISNKSKRDSQGQGSAQRASVIKDRKSQTVREKNNKKQ